MLWPITSRHVTLQVKDQGACAVRCPGYKCGEMLGQEWLPVLLTPSLVQLLGDQRTKHVYILSWPLLSCQIQSSSLLPFLVCVLCTNHATQLSLPFTQHFLALRRSFTPLLIRNYGTLTTVLLSLNWSSPSTFLLPLLYFEHLFPLFSSFLRSG